MKYINITYLVSLEIQMNSIPANQSVPTSLRKPKHVAFRSANRTKTIVDTCVFSVNQIYITYLFRCFSWENTRNTDTDFRVNIADLFQQSMKLIHKTTSLSRVLFVPT